MRLSRMKQIYPAPVGTPVLFIILLFLYLPAFGQQKSRSTAGMECSDVKAGSAVTQKTPTLNIGATNTKAFATVQLRRPEDDTEANSCTATYKLFLANDDGKFTSVKQLSEKVSGESVGAEMIGVSKRERMIAADFWWSMGDATGHTPVIYNLASKVVRLRALHDEISKQLPSCDYFEEFVGVTDAGEAIIRIPKYIDEGCPAQGKWLFDPQTGSVRRMKTGNVSNN